MPSAFRNLVCTVGRRTAANIFADATKMSAENIRFILAVYQSRDARTRLPDVKSIATPH